MRLETADGNLSRYPVKAAERGDNFFLEIPEKGGHSGFVSFHRDARYWSEARATDFLEQATALREGQDRRSGRRGVAPGGQPDPEAGGRAAFTAPGRAVEKLWPFPPQGDIGNQHI